MAFGLSTITLCQSRRHLATHFVVLGLDVLFIRFGLDVLFIRFGLDVLFIRFLFAPMLIALATVLVCATEERSPYAAGHAVVIRGGFGMDLSVPWLGHDIDPLISVLLPRLIWILHHLRRVVL